MNLLLISGGMDSAALAYWHRPELMLFIDYGQRSADGERIAATLIASALKLALAEIQVDFTTVGAGLLVGQPAPSLAPSTEWWPFRNQMLATVAAGWAVRDPRISTLVFGAVKNDGFHIDGTPEFYARLDSLLRIQEGAIGVSVPAIDMTTPELIRRSGLPMSLLGWTFSCHRGPLACGTCPGCIKQSLTRDELGLEVA